MCGISIMPRRIGELGPFFEATLHSIYVIPTRVVGALRAHGTNTDQVWRGKHKWHTSALADWLAINPACHPCQPPLRGDWQSCNATSVVAIIKPDTLHRRTLYFPIQTLRLQSQTGRFPLCTGHCLAPRRYMRRIYTYARFRDG